MKAGETYQLDFEPGLTERHKSLKACVRTCIYRYRGGHEAVAAALDISPSLLSRRLSDNPDDPRHLPIEDLEKIIEETGDLTPVYYLVEKYLRRPRGHREQLASRATALMEELSRTLAELQEPETARGGPVRRTSGL